MGQKAEHPQAVIERYHDHSLLRQGRTVIHLVRPGAADKGPLWKGGFWQAGIEILPDPALPKGEKLFAGLLRKVRWQDGFQPQPVPAVPRIAGSGGDRTDVAFRNNEHLYPVVLYSAFE